MSDKIVSWSAGDYTRRTGQHVDIYITQDSGQQTTLYEKNRVSMLLYNTGSRSTGDLIVLLYNTESWSAGDLVPEEPGQHAVILRWIQISRRLYTDEEPVQQAVI